MVTRLRSRSLLCTKSMPFAQWPSHKFLSSTCQTTHYDASHYRVFILVPRLLPPLLLSLAPLLPPFLAPSILRSLPPSPLSPSPSCLVPSPSSLVLFLNPPSLYPPFLPPLLLAPSLLSSLPLSLPLFPSSHHPLASLLPPSIVPRSFPASLPACLPPSGALSHSANVLPPRISFWRRVKNPTIDTRTFPWVLAATPRAFKNGSQLGPKIGSSYNIDKFMNMWQCFNIRFYASRKSGFLI